jgi:hypothetical protein
LVRGGGHTLWRGEEGQYFGRRQTQLCAGIFKPLWSPGIDAKASIPPAYVAWLAGTITLFLSVPSPHRFFKNSSSVYFKTTGGFLKVFSGAKIAVLEPLKRSTGRILKFS